MKLSLTLFLCLLASAQAAVKLPSVFSDHVILMRQAAVPVWGKADPGETVIVGLAGQSARAVANADGKWKVTLDLHTAGAGPFEFTVNDVVIHDVVVGQTWLVIGQSNAERMLKETADAPAEAERSTNPLIREFRIEKKGFDTPQEDAKGSWVLADPQTTPTFSAIGYYFAKKLQAELHEPIGIIDGSWGGARISRRG